MGRAFGGDAERPAGEWVNSTFRFEVAGIQHRRAAALAFSRAVARAERRGLKYWAEPRLEPDNPHDRNAIAILGTCEVKGWFGPVRRESWHIGYVPATIAAELRADLLDAGLPIAATVNRIWLDGDYVEIHATILGPPGQSLKARRRREKAAPPR